jgi:preprotein translocase subunit SecF
MKKIIALSFLCFISLTSCVIQKRYHLKGFQISKTTTGNKVKFSTKKKNTTLTFVENAKLNTKLDHSKKVNQEFKNHQSSHVSLDQQPELQVINQKTSVSLSATSPLENRIQNKNVSSQFVFAKNTQVSDYSQLQKTEFKQLSTSKSIDEHKVTPSKMPLWKKAVIALSVVVGLISLYIALVFSEVFAFGN